MKKIIFIVLFGTLFLNKSNAQGSKNEESAAKIKPFSVSLFGVTVTGTYSEGCMSTYVVNGTSILWGAISWGGSTQITCSAGCSFCKVETVISIGRMAVTTSDAGEKCFEKANAPKGVTPVLVGVKDGALTFAVDIKQTAEHQKNLYNTGIFELTSPFVLDPGAVKSLQLVNSDAEMGYIIPAGKYPLYKDGDIYFWTFEPPKQ